MYQFYKCCKRAIWSDVVKKIDCKIPSYGKFVGENSPLKECTNQSSALNSERQLFKSMLAVWDSPSIYGCGKPCKQTSYSYNIDYYHQNSWLDHENLTAFSDENFHLALFYNSLTIEEHFETLVYDTGSMLAAAGVCFINVLQAAFAHAYPKSAKRH